MRQRRSDLWLPLQDDVRTAKRAAQCDVAGAPRLARRADVACVRPMSSSAPRRDPCDASGYADDFEDFMVAGLEGLRSPRTVPDPVFRERLRKRIWRTHVMARGMPDPSELH